MTITAPRQTAAQIVIAGEARLNLRDSMRDIPIDDLASAIAEALLYHHDTTTAHTTAQTAERMIERGMP